jgi:hypothetical protein
LLIDFRLFRKVAEMELMSIDESCDAAIYTPAVPHPELRYAPLTTSIHSKNTEPMAND